MQRSFIGRFGRQSAVALWRCRDRSRRAAWRRVAGSATSLPSRSTARRVEIRRMWRAPGLLLMSQDVELRSPLLGSAMAQPWKEWSRPIRELRQDDPDEAGRNSCARPFVDPW